MRFRCSVKYIQKGMARYMAEKEGWNQFAASGKVMDYLEYKGCLHGLANVSNVVPAPGMMGSCAIAQDEEEHEDDGGTRAKG